MNIQNGFKLVPVEPTEEMVSEVQDLGRIDPDEVEAIWCGMLASAPTPPQPIYDEAKERDLFEAYASIHYRLQELPLDFEDGEYIEPDVQYSWEAWEARAKAVEVGHE